MNLNNVAEITIPEGNVVNIIRDGSVLWENTKLVCDPVISLEWVSTENDKYGGYTYKFAVTVSGISRKLITGLRLRLQEYNDHWQYSERYAKIPVAEDDDTIEGKTYRMSFNYSGIHIQGAQLVLDFHSLGDTVSPMTTATLWRPGQKVSKP